MRTLVGFKVILALRHMFRKSPNTWARPSPVSAPPKKSSAKFAILGKDLLSSFVCMAFVYAFCATVAAFLVPMTIRVNWNRPLGVQKAVISRASWQSGMDQYCLRPSAENLYLLLATLYNCCHASVYVGTAFWIVSLHHLTTILDIVVQYI